MTQAAERIRQASQYGNVIRMESVWQTISALGKGDEARPFLNTTVKKNPILVPWEAFLKNLQRKGALVLEVLVINKSSCDFQEICIHCFMPALSPCWRLPRRHQKWRSLAPMVTWGCLALMSKVQNAAETCPVVTVLLNAFYFSTSLPSYGFSDV